MLNFSKIRAVAIAAGILAGSVTISTQAISGGLNLTFEFSNGIHQVHKRRISTRQIARMLRREGFYPVSRIRFGRNSFRVGVENDFGEVFRVTGNAQTGEIYSIRSRQNARHSPTRNWRTNPRRGYNAYPPMPAAPWGNNGWNSVPQQPYWQNHNPAPPVALVPSKRFKKRKIHRNRNARLKTVQRKPAAQARKRTAKRSKPRIIPLKKRIDPDAIGAKMFDSTNR